MAVYTYSNKDENRFWLQIMGDNALLIRNRFLPDGTEERKAKELADRFDMLYMQADKNLTGGQLAKLNQDAYAATQDLKKYELMVLRNQVTKGFFVYLKPSYLNNMVSMADEYLYLLGTYLNNKQPAFDPVVQDIFWLPIFYEETNLIADSVGNYDESFRQKADLFSTVFLKFFEFAVMLQGIFRIGETDFPIANQYRIRIREELESFAQFVVDLIELARKNRIPGTLTLLNMDHIYRMLCYYTTQLSVVANTAKPACDPGSPRRVSFLE